MFKRALLFVSILLITFSMYSQNGFGGVYTEVGITAGPVFFKSDYGERGNFENFTRNNGYSLGITYYLSGINNMRSLSDYFKVRLELSYTKADFKHYGKYVDPAKTSLFSNQLRGMYGSTSFTSLGFQIEYYPLMIDDYNGGATFNPYFGLGSHVNIGSSAAKSTLGELGTTITTPQKYMNGYRNDSFTVPSITLAVGSRYKLSDYHSLFAEIRGQYFFSDWVDGLNPDKALYKENKSNDWNVGMNFGYIYYFN